MINQSTNPNIDFNFESISPLEISSLESSTEGTKKVKDEENQTDNIQDKIKVKKNGFSYKSASSDALWDSYRNNVSVCKPKL